MKDMNIVTSGCPTDNQPKRTSTVHFGCLFGSPARFLLPLALLPAAGFIDRRTPGPARKNPLLPQKSRGKGLAGKRQILRRLTAQERLGQERIRAVLLLCLDDSRGLLHESFNKLPRLRWGMIKLFRRCSDRFHGAAFAPGYAVISPGFQGSFSSYGLFHEPISIRLSFISSSPDSRPLSQIRPGSGFRAG